MDTIINGDLKKLIEENALGFATINTDNTPHCIAVGFVKVVSVNELLITDDYMVETTRNIKRNKNVSLVVWNSDWKNNCIGYELSGLAEHFREGEWLNAVKKIPENLGEPCKGAILIKINKIRSLV